MPGGSAVDHDRSSRPQRLIDPQPRTASGVIPQHWRTPRVTYRVPEYQAPVFQPSAGPADCAGESFKTAMRGGIALLG